MKIDTVVDKDLQNFWEEQANKLKWFEKWKKVLEWNPPFARWFVGGKLNASYLCLDRHIGTDKENKIAFYCQDEQGDKKSFTYKQLYDQVNKFSCALKNLGVKKGDVVILYLSMIPQAIISMLSVARIGAIQSVVFSGFSSKALRDRIDDTKAKFLITADFGLRRGKFIPLKQIVDNAVQNCPTIQKVVLIKRIDKKVKIKKGRDFFYDEIMQKADDYVEPEEVESNHPLFILYTSGTTGKPKGIVHSTGGYLVYVYNTFKQCFNIKKDSVYWCTGDIGWITGHSYIAYAPLMHGITQIIYEGAPNYPDPSIWWQIIEKYKVSIFYTSPTAIRMFMQFGEEWIEKCNLDSLKILGTVGEPINPQVWKWYFTKIGKEKCPIIDTWWQTETGGFMIAPKAYTKISDLKPGSVTFSLPGIKADVVNEKGQSVAANQKGYLIVKKPWPGMMMGIYNDPERYKKVYWSKFKDVYYSGDYAKKDEDGYFWLLGRADETLNIAGHRIGTAEIENAVITNHYVAEAAVVGVPDDIKGENFVIFAVLKKKADSQDLHVSIIQTLKDQIGSLVRPKEIFFVSGLPKTRSGKILRRVLKAIVVGSEIGDITTLEDKSVVVEIKEKCLFLKDNF